MHFAAPTGDDNYKKIVNSAVIYSFVLFRDRINYALVDLAFTVQLFCTEAGFFTRFISQRDILWRLILLGIDYSQFSSE